MTLDNNWFTEVFEQSGTAFSLKAKKLHEEQSEYQKLEIYETEKFGKLMVIDGCIMLTDRDNFLYHEMMSHPAMFTHPDPKKVVIIGGGDCGTMKEVLRHESLEHVLQVDIDERVTRLSEQYFPALCESNNDPRAELYFGDGIEWMKNAEAGSVDIVIVDSTDPVGPAEGLFTEAFYKDCFNALGKDGILVQQSESPLIHMDLIKSIHTAMRNAGYAHVNTLSFPQPVYPTGWWSSTMASKSIVPTAFRKQDAANKSFDTVYYNADIHAGALAMPEFFRRSIV